MPLFEGISYSGDKNIVVLDIGAAYTKCGLAGETGPRCILPSEVKSAKTGKVVKIWSCDDDDELFESLKDFLFILYFRHLLVNPKDRRMVICESMLCPSKFREILARVLFRHFEVGSVLYVPGHILSLLTLGVNTGLVLDVGYTEALVLPVYEDIPVLKAWQALPLGGRAIHDRLSSLLLASATVTTEEREECALSSLPGCLNEQILEDIKARCCFVTELGRAKLIHDVTVYGADEAKLPAPPPGVQYPLDGGKVLHIDGKIREHTCEVLFEQDHEEKSVATLLLDAILQCPIDIRRDLAENIVFLGGTTMLPGFGPRIKAELYNLLQKDKYKQLLAIKKFKFHQPPTKANYTAWLGGALVGALETLPARSVSRDAYLQSGKLSDWCSLADDLDLEKEDKLPVKHRS